MKSIINNRLTLSVTLAFVICLYLAVLSAAAQSPFTNGDGTEQSPYVITTLEQLEGIRNHLNSHFVLGNDIDIKGEEWVPIGNNDNRFNGTLDGKGFTISNFKIDKSDVDEWRDKQDIGLFGFIDVGSKINNLNITGADVKGGYNVGLLIGRNDGGILDNIRVSGNVFGDSNVGGLVGLIRFEAVVKDSYSNAIVTGYEQAGGLIGSNYQGEIHNSTSEATVFGSSGYGGLVGSNSGLLTNSVSHASVKGIISWSGGGAGGLVGYNNGEIKNSHSRSPYIQGTSGVGGLVGSNSGSILQSSSISIILGSSYEIGGLVGVNSGIIEQCFTIADFTGAVFLGGLVGTNGVYSSDSQPIIKDSYAIGNIRSTSGLAGGSGSGIGGAIGYIGNGVAENVYFVGRLVSPSNSDLPMGATKNAVWNSSLTPDHSQSHGGDVIGLNETEMRDINNYLSLGWDFAEVWDIVDGSFPFLRNVQQETKPGITDDWLFEALLTTEVGFYAQWQSVYFGQSSVGTDGFDLGVDVPLPPSAPSETTRFFIRNTEMANILGNIYKNDTRAAKDISLIPEVWKIEIEKPEAGEIYLRINRPLGFDYPFVVFDGDGWHFVRYGDLSLTLDHDGLENIVLEVHVGDTTPPQLTVETELSGAVIWDASVERELSWQATDDNHLDLVLVEVSTDNGSTWSEIYSGLESSVSWTPPSVTINEQVLFRLKATDRVGLSAGYISEYPITVASNSQTVAFNPGWNLVGSPFITVDNKNSILQASTYRFGWSGSVYNQVSEYQPHKAHWLGSQIAGEDVINGSIAEESVSVSLHEGWNMFASPIIRTVYLDSMVVTNLSTNETKFYTDAIESSWITNPYKYSEKKYQTVTEVVPFSGYWIGLLITEAQLEIPIHRYRQLDEMPKSQDSPHIYITVSNGMFEQKLILNTETVEFQPVPPSIPTGNYVGLVGHQTSLGYLYLSTQIPKDEIARTFIQRDSNDEEYLVTWEKHQNPYVNATLVMPDGSEFSLQTQGNATWMHGKPSIVTSPVTTSVNDGLDVPTELVLHQNYPNPFNPTTTFSYSLPQTSNVRLEIFSITGQRLAILFDGQKSSGNHTINFDAINLSSGMYIYRLITSEGVLTRSMTLIK
jgi:hypothetical protein